MKQNNLKMNNFSTPLPPKPIRQALHMGELYYSIVDIIENLTGTIAPRTYWTRLKRRDIQLLSVVEQLNMLAPDGHFYLTEAANKRGIYRILMSVPSPNVEPFKSWLAGSGKRTLAEIENRALRQERLPDITGVKDFSDEPVSNALTTSELSTSLVTQWQQRGVAAGIEFTLLTATIAQWTFGITIREHKVLKGLTTQNLRQHMTALESIFIALGEESTKHFILKDNAQGFIENFGAAQQGGNLAGEARKTLEKQLKMRVVSAQNCLKSGDGG
jgi:DNA-damage-inducible protein D